ncbi:helix-turn-helix domain-containing protein [Marinomonas epiphytica]
MEKNLSQNLRLLCSFYKSVAEVCRRLGLNRAQFNRYLNASSMPSASTLRRICDFFGVETHELILPHEDFQRLIQTRPVIVRSQQEESLEQRHWGQLSANGQQGVEKYAGYYFEYYLSMAYPGKILRTLIHIEIINGKAYYHRTERLNPTGLKKAFHGVYKGGVQLLADRLFLLDYEAQTQAEMTQTILYPSFRNRVERLSGLRLGVSASSSRVPCCVRVVYEAIGYTMNKRTMLSLCGLYDIDSEKIDKDIRKSVLNSMGSNDWHFRAQF